MFTLLSILLGLSIGLSIDVNEDEDPMTPQTTKEL
jgi:hypothetical protein